MKDLIKSEVKSTTESDTRISEKDAPKEPRSVKREILYFLVGGISAYIAIILIQFLFNGADGIDYIYPIYASLALTTFSTIRSIYSKK